MSKDWKGREKNMQIAHQRNISVHYAELKRYRLKYLYIWNNVIKIAKKLFVS